MLLFADGRPQPPPLPSSMPLASSMPLPQSCLTLDFASQIVYETVKQRMALEVKGTGIVGLLPCRICRLYFMGKVPCTGVVSATAD